MAECPKCKSTDVIEVGPNSYECPYCGTKFNGGYTKSAASGTAGSGKDEVNIGLVIVSALFWIVGIALYFLKKEEQPKAAKAYLTTSIIVVIIFAIAAASSN